MADAAKGEGNEASVNEILDTNVERLSQVWVEKQCIAMSTSSQDFLPLNFKNHQYGLEMHIQAIQQRYSVHTY